MGSVTFEGKVAKNLKIAYIGGGSRGWAWTLMSDLAMAEDLNGTVALYDIDYEAAKKNAVIGNRINALPDAVSDFTYVATETIGEALTGADFVIISILPGTFDEMESDVHTPEKYGIYQPIGDTTGPGGIVRALRAIPMFREIARAIREYCPDAWVINYTNPMTLCVRALYKEFPEIKAFGCCHEVFGTQWILVRLLRDRRGITAQLQDIKTNVIGVNHFTWITKATYRNMDLYDLYREHVADWKVAPVEPIPDENWVNRVHKNDNCVKFDLFDRYGVMAAAGDAHISEFCEGSWYLESPETIMNKWRFALRTVAYRKQQLVERLERSERLASGEEVVSLARSGEEGVRQIRAILGLSDFVTNVNLPNMGQIPDLPIGAVVETNASFTADSVLPVYAGPIPKQIYNLITRIVGEQEMVLEAAFNYDLELAFQAFANDPLVRLPVDEARKLFDEMIENTKAYLTDYFK